ncbi:hypothetical protein L3X38_036986 [Prunus dulcis]|uniref:Uncharacterized protein n=1 Tax=Prunus dulcis TaxID=3755 RepID=A0AAD4V2H8_PRUDU|nr:hypothetical protein L3X38_036986 [Prunus dulcis]
MQEAKKNKCDAAKGKLRGTQRIVVENHKDINGLRKFTLKTKWKGIKSNLLSFRSHEIEVAGICDEEKLNQGEKAL